MTTQLKTKPFDAADYLDTEAGVAAYLSDAFESGDDAVFQEALQTAARARGMTDVARASGLGRESLYKALQANAQPRFATVRKVMSALGVQLIVVANKKASVSKRTTCARKPRGDVIRTKLAKLNLGQADIDDAVARTRRRVAEPASTYPAKRKVAKRKT